MICIFDCETIPDAKLVKSVFNIDDGTDFEICQEALKRFEKEKGTTFLPIPFHQVVAISAVIATKEGEFIKVSSIDGENEEQLMVKNGCLFRGLHVCINWASNPLPVPCSPSSKILLS